MSSVESKKVLLCLSFTAVCHHQSSLAPVRHGAAVCDWLTVRVLMSAAQPLRLKPKPTLSAGKTYCAAFCAFLVLIAGLGNNAVCKSYERRTVTTYCRMSLGCFVYTQASVDFFFAISLLGKQGYPYLLRGSVVYIFSGVFIWMQYVRGGKMCLHIRNLSCTTGK